MYDNDKVLDFLYKLALDPKLKYDYRKDANAVITKAGLSYKEGTLLQTGDIDRISEIFVDDFYEI